MSAEQTQHAATIARLAALESELETLREAHLRVSGERDGLRRQLEHIASLMPSGILDDGAIASFVVLRNKIESLLGVADDGSTLKICDAIRRLITERDGALAELAEERRFTGRLFDALRGGK